MMRKQFSTYFVVIAFAAIASGCARDAVDAGASKKSHTRLDLAKDLLLKGNIDQAEHEATEALGYNPKNEEAYNLLGLVDFIRAVNNVRLLEQEDCLTGIDAEALRSEVDRSLVDAAKDLERATGLAPDYGEAWANRGVVAMQLREYDEAIQFLSTALAHRPRLDQIGLTRANLGWAQFQDGNDVQAAKELRQALQFSRGMCVANYRLGRVYFGRKEWEKALQQFQAVVQDASCRMQEAHLYHLKTMVRLQQSTELPTALEKCILLAPKSCVARECSALAQ